MGLFKREKVHPLHSEPVEETVFVMPGSVVRTRQPEPGGPEKEYQLVGCLVDGVFTIPPRLVIQNEKGTFELGDVMSLTAAEHATLSKSNVLVPVEDS